MRDNDIYFIIDYFILLLLINYEYEVPNFNPDRQPDELNEQTFFNGR